MINVDTIGRKEVLLSKNIIFDIDRYFDSLRLTESDILKELIQEIDSGTYFDAVSFIDRFGIKQETKNLSTGCKAAIVLSTQPNKKLSLIECGDNAIVAIFKHFRHGDVVMYERGYRFDIVDADKIKIDIGLDGYRFKTLERLNYYITDEQGYEVDLSREGIECIQ